MIKNKGLYYRGLWGVIPIFGVIIGLSLILKGIFKFKDRKLTIVGSFAVLCSMLISGYCYYQLFLSEEAQVRKARIAQIEINELVKDIEFWKTQHGNYPDSLKQVLSIDRLAPLVDPLSSSWRGRTELFRYENLGNRYRIFSVGIDKTAGTDDDIFPDFNNPGNNKFGFSNR